jgi:hypothetical protein
MHDSRQIQTSQLPFLGLFRRAQLSIGSELTLLNPFFSSEEAPCPYDESPKAFAGDELARIMHDLAAETSCLR